MNNNLQEHKMLPLKHYYVYRLSALGDVMLITGPLAYWNKKYGWTFTVITKKSFSPLFENNPAVLNVIGLDGEDLKFPALLQKFKELNRESQGANLIDLHGTLRSFLLKKLWGGKCFTYKKYSLIRRLFIRTRSKRAAAKLLKYNVPQRYFLSFRQDVPDRIDLVPRLYLSSDEACLAKQTLADALMDENQAGNANTTLAPVILHPYATHEQKMWPERNWRALIILLEQKSIPWIIVGVGKSLFSEHKNDLSNKTTIRELCSILSLGGVLVTADSGPMHLAAGVDTPVVALFGPTTRHWGFFPEGAFDQVLEKNVSGRPSSLHGKSSSSASLCGLELISPEEVLNSILKLPTYSNLCNQDK